MKNYSADRDGWEPILEMEANSIHEVIALLLEDKYSFLKGSDVCVSCEEDPDDHKWITL